MGLFNFIKEAGEKIWGGASVSGSEDKTEMLHSYIKKLGIPGAENVSVQVNEGGTATVTGDVQSQEAKEKILVAAGNVAGISAVNDAMTVPSTVDESRFYTVKSGDTLSAISKSMYGTSGEYPRIFNANKPMLTHPDKIYPGQVLIIPHK
ncbi:peptidoglycan-binding protein LysM [Klebsiella aerogenes]|uniref:peptidoglycan-binding protein LysM n=1 Tax=Klebsiella aerogenes TaxID=548 RepID=UPI0037AC54B9